MNTGIHRINLNSCAHLPPRDKSVEFILSSPFSIVSLSTVPVRLFLYACKDSGEQSFKSRSTLHSKYSSSLLALVVTFCSISIVNVDDDDADDDLSLPFTIVDDDNDEDEDDRF